MKHAIPEARISYFGQHSVKKKNLPGICRGRCRSDARLLHGMHGSHWLQHGFEGRRPGLWNQAHRLIDHLRKAPLARPEGRANVEGGRAYKAVSLAAVSSSRHAVRLKHPSVVVHQRVEGRVSDSAVLWLRGSDAVAVGGEEVLLRSREVHVEAGHGLVPSHAAVAGEAGESLIGPLVVEVEVVIGGGRRPLLEEGRPITGL